MCRSKALLCVCTRCRKNGSVNKRLHECEVESARVHEQRLTSTQAVEQVSELVSELRHDKRALQMKQESLEAEICELREQLVTTTRVTEVERGVKRESVEHREEHA